MPWDCGFLCLLTERRRYCEVLWRRRLLITNDERKAKRRFLNLMRGFDCEDLRVLRRAIESSGHDIKLCAPGPPMDLVEETFENEEDILLRHHQPKTSVGCSTTVLSNRPKHSINRLERDRILFQRQKFPELFTQTNPSQHSAGAGPPIPFAAYPVSPFEYSAHYHRNSWRKPSNVKRFGFDENVDLISPNEDEYGHLGNASTLQRFDEPEVGVGGGLLNQNDDLGLIPQIDRPMSMPYLCCKMWRWKNLQVDAALHRLDPLPWCRFGRVTINNATVSCCNPYHYGLWIRPEQSPSLTSSDDQLQGVSGILANGLGHLSRDYTMTKDTGFVEGGLTSTSTGVNNDNNIRSGGAIGHVRSVFKSIEQHIKGNNDDELPPMGPPPPVPPLDVEFETAPPLLLSSNHIGSVHPQPYAWGRMARWERKQRIGEVVALVEQFIAVGKLAGTVYDGQDVKSSWDLDNGVSFSLIKQTENANFEDIWLYNSGDKPLFISISRSLSNVSRSDTIRRLSPGYCIRVHRIPIMDITTTSPAAFFGGAAMSSNNATEYGTSSNNAVVATTGLVKSTTTTTTLIGGGASGRVPIIATTTTANANSSAVAPNGNTSGVVHRSSAATKTFAFLTISAGVGWGINYQRLYVTDVPCRYEIIFS